MSAPHKPHYSYEDEDQSAVWNPAKLKAKTPTPLKNYNSIDNIAEFLLRGEEIQCPENGAGRAYGTAWIPSGQKVKHPKYGEGRCISAKGMGRCQDYGTIPSLRFEEIGGEVRAAGEGVTTAKESRDWRELQIPRYARDDNPQRRSFEITIREERERTAIMANTKKLTKDERKKSKRAARKKIKAEKPKKPRDYARGSKKPKVKKLARGQAKR